MTEQISVERQQLRMLVEAIKKIVTNPRTPNWIKNPLETAVREAKALKPSTSPVQEKTDPEGPKMEDPEPVELCIGCVCKNSEMPEDECLYEIVREGLAIDGVQLYDVKVVKGDKRTPKGVIQHNVPATLLFGIQAPRRVPSSDQVQQTASTPRDQEAC